MLYINDIPILSDKFGYLIPIACFIISMSFTCQFLTHNISTSVEFISVHYLVSYILTSDFCFLC